jgi:metallo-beta-lactamase class B
MMRIRALAGSAALLLVGAAGLAAQADPAGRARNQPMPPFRILGNLYYVGASDIAVYLITTPAGHILIDGGYVETVPLIRRSVEQLGFRLGDVKILLNSHAHQDHAGGFAELQRLTGARLYASVRDAPLLESGGKSDPLLDATFPPVKVAKTLADGEVVRLGGTELVAHLTPGHTPGCTSWSMRIADAGTRRDVVFLGSTSVLPGMRFTGKPTYPGIADDYERSFRVLKALPCDVFLGSHGVFFGLAEKAKRLGGGEQPNPFVDPAGYHAFLESSEQAFRSELSRQSQSRGGS